jgi:hypothetical protein
MLPKNESLYGTVPASSGIVDAARIRFAMASEFVPIDAPLATP